MKLGLIGVNTITQLVVGILSNGERPEVFCLYDDDPKKLGKDFHGLSVRGSISQIKNDYQNNMIDAAHICLGEKHLGLKKDLFSKLKQFGLAFPNFIHPSCILAGTSHLGDGNVLSFGVIMGHNTRISSNTTIWAGSVIEHDSVIGSHSYIGPNVTISGFAEVGECTLIGSGAVILPEIKIGRNCVIGAGAVVTRNVPDNSKVKGNPAK